MVYWEFLVTGKLEFTQFDPLVAEKHSGLQGLKWEGRTYWIKRIINHEFKKYFAWTDFLYSVAYP